MIIFLWTILLGLLIWRSTRIGSRIEKSILIPLLLASLALVLVHAGIRWYPRPWYFIPTAAIFAIGSALGIAYIVQNQRTIFLITMLFSAYFLITGYIFWQIGYYPWQEEMLAANQWLEKNVSQEDKIGSFNAGIYAYYSGRTIINLDGVVNNNAFEAIKDSNLISYIHQSGIKYLIDYDHAVQSEYGPFLGEDPKNLDQIAILGGSGSSDLGMLRVYRVMDP